MEPMLFALGPLQFPAYSTVLAIGWGLAVLLTVRESRYLGLDPEQILDLNLWIVAWGLIGSRILHVFADGHLQDYIDLCLDPRKVPAVDALVRTCTQDRQCGYDYLCDAQRGVCYPPKDCLAWAKLWRGGLAYYGGLLLAIPLSVRFVRRRGMPFLRVADLASPAIILGLFFGRLGCYLNGCCYGKVTQGAFGVRFPVGSLPWQMQLKDHLIRTGQAMVPVHATQLYESLGCLALFSVLYYVVRPRKRWDGQVFGAMLVLYAVMRSLIEIVRDDERGVLFGWLSTSQMISAPLFALGVYVLLRRPGVSEAIDKKARDAAKQLAIATNVNQPAVPAPRPPA